MALNQLLPFLSTAIMIVFVALVLRRWWYRKPPHLLLWAVGLGMFTLGVAAEAISAVAWSGLVFRSWYLFGATLSPAWIGQGTVYLLARRRAAHVTLGLVSILSLVAAYGIFTLQLDSAAFSADISLAEQFKGILPEGAWVRAMAAFFGIYGTIAVGGGAIYSGWLFWRKRTLPNRMWGNILIAVAVLLLASAGTLAGVGSGQLLYLSELAAAILFFAGFLVASRRASQPDTPSAPPTRRVEGA